MEYQLLGKTDHPISRLGLGCWAFGGHGWGIVDDQESIQTIRTAYEGGINFFDTANVYGFGHSEEILAAALGKDIEKVVIATKFGVRWDDSGRTRKDISPDYARQAIEESLKRLKLDCIPLYQIHWPDGLTPIDDTVCELIKLRDEGKLRWLGVSNFSSELVRQTQGVTRIESSQFEYNLISRSAEAEALPICREYQMAGLTYGSIAKGLLSGKFSLFSRFPDDDIRSRDVNFQGERFAKNIHLAAQVSEVGKKYEKSASQVAIRWLLQQPSVACTIVGAKHPQQVLDNLGAVGWSLLPTDVAFLSDASHKAGSHA